MSDGDPRDERLDEVLSALVDGDLDATAAAELRARLEGSPEMRARLAELRRVDAALRGVPEPEVPGDLLARVKAEAGAEGPAAPAAVAGRGRAPRRLRRWLLAGGAAAAAAALALYLASGVGPAPEGAEPARVARVPETPVAPAAPEAPPTRVAEAPPEAAPPAAAADLASASEEEIRVAMELDTLEILDILEHLDVLESLDALEGPERG